MKTCPRCGSPRLVSSPEARGDSHCADCHIWWDANSLYEASDEPHETAVQRKPVVRDADLIALAALAQADAMSCQAENDRILFEANASGWRAGSFTLRDPADCESVQALRDALGQLGTIPEVG